MIMIAFETGKHNICETVNKNTAEVLVGRSSFGKQHIQLEK